MLNNTSLHSLFNDLETKVYDLSDNAKYYWIKLKEDNEKVNPYEDMISFSDRFNAKINTIVEYINIVQSNLQEKYSVHNTKIFCKTDEIPTECFIHVVASDKKDSKIYDIVPPHYDPNISVFSMNPNYLEFQIIGTINNVVSIDSIISTAFKEMLSIDSYDLWNKVSVISSGNGFTKIKLLKGEFPKKQNN